jgi:Holliday junction resolvase
VGKSQREKGRRGEQEVARILRSRGFDAERIPNSGGLTEKGDVKSKDLPRLHFEVKFQETWSLLKWLRQAIEEALPTQVPVVVFKKSREPWRVSVTLEHYLDLIEDSEYDQRKVSCRPREQVNA